MKHFPPYGREVSCILGNPAQLKTYSGSSRDGSRGTVWISTGPAALKWREDRPSHLSVVLPEGQDPAAFRWDFLKGHEPPLVLTDDIDASAEIAAAMLRDGIASVLTVGNIAGIRYVLDQAA